MALTENQLKEMLTDLEKIAAEMQTVLVTLDECHVYFDKRQDVITKDGDISPNLEMQIFGQVVTAIDIVKRFLA